ncbi:MAG: metallophosphoesterase [Clostridiales Family XIII bacterium]|jgi:predicted MPP superfamily phosphohydrolase|nr:metallophosphoesterase [Clostridiales Family XIII bacterium]
MIPGRMHFGLGWIATFAILVALHLFLFWHWGAIEFKGRRRLKSLICIATHIAAAVTLVVYFAGFFGGRSAEPYMRPLSYVAGFYLCEFFYLSGVCFGWDVGRIVLRVLARVCGRRRSGRGAAFTRVGVPAPVFLGGTRDRRIPKRGGFPAVYGARTTLVILLVCTVMSAFAFYVPQHIRVTRYDVEIDKRGSDLDHLKAVMISDAHMGVVIREEQIDEIVRLTMAEDPDVIFLAGDIFDEGTQTSLKAYASERFKNLRAKYGVYFILGNHDDYRRDTEDVLGYLRRAGVVCLLDEVVLAGDAFYVVGREDRRADRDELSILEARLTKDLPVILVDHKPVTDESAESGRIQLQLSGHTHDGQIFPAHLFDPITRTLSYGLYRRGEEQIIVSSGVGEFGVPVRLGSPAEIVAINIDLR